MLEQNTKAPNFALPDQDGTARALSDFLGSYVLVYFYPKDDTPGCTKEACMIAEAYGDFEKMGVAVLGISSDTSESHKKFRAKYGLPFTLLSDPKKETIGAYGAKNAAGSTKRISYLVGKDGTILKVYPKVDPANHALHILKDVADIAK